VTSSPERWKGFCVNGWKMRHRKDCQWCCGEGEGNVTQPLHTILELKRRANSSSAEGGVDILRCR